MRKAYTLVDWDKRIVFMRLVGFVVGHICDAIAQYMGGTMRNVPAGTSGLGSAGYWSCELSTKNGSGGLGRSKDSDPSILFYYHNYLQSIHISKFSMLNITS